MLTSAELHRLVQEVRERHIDVVSEKGGHFGLLHHPSVLFDRASSAQQAMDWIGIGEDSINVTGSRSRSGS